MNEKITSIEPVGNDLLVKPWKDAVKEVGGIILPEKTSFANQKIGTIIKMGPGGEKDKDGKLIEFDRENIKVGAMVLLQNENNVVFYSDTEAYWICPVNNVLAVIENI